MSSKLPVELTGFEESETTEEKVNRSSTMIDDKLYDEDEDVVHKLINARRISLPKGGEDWEILEDNKVVFILKGIKLTRKQRTVLRTVGGLNMLISEYKAGNKSVTNIKKKLNDHWKSVNDTV